MMIAHSYSVEGNGGIVIGRWEETLMIAAQYFIFVRIESVERDMLLIVELVVIFSKGG
jgi:hypothetical protein